MFDVGFSELMMIALVALIVLGPERLPKAARFAGLWVRRARSQWHSVKSELENELADEEMRRSIRNARDELRDAHAAFRDGGEQLHAQVMDANPHQMTTLDAPALQHTEEVAMRSLPPATVEPQAPAADEQR